MFSNYFGICVQGLIKAILENLFQKQEILVAKLHCPLQSLTGAVCSPVCNPSCFQLHYSSRFWHLKTQEQIQSTKKVWIFEIAQYFIYFYMCLLYQLRLHLLSQRLYHINTVFHSIKLLMSIIFSSANSAEILTKVTKQKFKRRISSCHLSVVRS